MEKLKQMKECLTGIVEGQIYGNIDTVDAKELGEAVDMIKDLAEAIYYCTITEAMEKDDGGSSHRRMYYTPVKMRDGRPMPMHDYEPMHPYEKDLREWRDTAPRHPHEGKSPEYRKMYMSGKGVKDKTHQMKELENYMHELMEDITEMIEDASPEEKALLQQKISMLATKIK